MHSAWGSVNCAVEDASEYEVLYKYFVFKVQLKDALSHMGNIIANENKSQNYECQNGLVWKRENRMKRNLFTSIKCRVKNELINGLKA